MNIGSLLTQSALVHGEVVGIRCGDVVRTYSDWNARSSALAHGLQRRGVQPGDRVAVLQTNGPALLESLFAIFKAGAVAVPINAKLHHEEFRFIIEHCEVAAVLMSSGFEAGLCTAWGGIPSFRAVVTDGDVPWAEPLEALVDEGDAEFADVERAVDDVCWMFYTSGTTGRPKGAMISHGNLDFMCRQYPSEVRRVVPGEVALHVAPLTHAGGLWALPLVQAGATHLLPVNPQFDPESVVELIERERPQQIVFMAPTMITMLLDTPSIADRQLDSVEFIGYGGSPAYSSELDRAIHRFGPVLCQIYGQGESPMTISMLSPEDHVAGSERLSSAGRARGGIEVALLAPNGDEVPTGDIGEVVVRGPVVMKGYWKDPAATEEAFAGGWYHTGDLGRFDDEGYLHLLDRLKDLIISGGSNVYGREVEDVLLLHPEVADVAVIGLPDVKWVEVVTAVIVPKPGCQPNVEELTALCGAHLARFKLPRRWEFREQLPKNAYGKVLKRELRSMLAAEDPDRIDDK
jgi:acyl-CoA synthetase (AMP-forming)/AMP-acid ligase II